MKFLKTIFAFLLCCTATAAYSQNDSAFTFIKTIKGTFTNFSVDNLDNIYLFNATNQLKKVNSKGDSAGVFNDVKRYGAVSSIDVSNPLKILLYYKNFTTIIVLDRFLNPRNTINLRKQNIFSVNSIANAYDNNIWLFDEQEYKLKKMADDGRLLQESTDFRLFFDSVPTAIQLIDQSNFLYLYDTAKGFYIFDYYGAFKNRLPFLHWNNVAVSNNIIYGFENSIMYSYQLTSFNLKKFTLPAFWGSFKAIKAVNNKVYLLKQDGIHIYQIK